MLRGQIKFLIKEGKSGKEVPKYACRPDLK
jgi:hypothetical protein